MTANVDAMVRAGVDAYRAGNKAEARTLLERAIELDGYNESAWLWLSAVVETKEEQQTCLENVLVINPDNERARQGLKSLGIDPDSVINPPAVEAAPAFEQDSFDGFSTDTDTTTDDVFGSDDDLFADDADDDLFGDIDFGADDGSFSLDDAVFEDPVAEEEIYEEELYDDELFTDDEYYEDDAYYDEEILEDGDDLYADLTTFEEFQEAVGDDLEYDESVFATDPFYVPPPPEPEPVLTMEDYFAMIPAEIAPTRLPGTDESVSSIHYVIIGVLGLVNLGALAFVALQFIG